ncbi:MAG: hypothetical protein Q4F13_14205 [Pseudomonadota bacterium]|nr:hypothetical protein [Pseudomonadota bacterium]
MPNPALELSLLLTAMAVATAAPLLAVSYLRPILRRVLQHLCPDEGVADFWLRCCQLLALCGSLVLTLLLGHFGAGQPLAEVLHRSLLLAAGGVFLSVGFIARSVWSQVRRQQADARQATWLDDARASPISAAPAAPAAPSAPNPPAAVQVPS